MTPPPGQGPESMKDVLHLVETGQLSPLRAFPHLHLLAGRSGRTPRPAPVPPTRSTDRAGKSAGASHPVRSGSRAPARRSEAPPDGLAQLEALIGLERVKQLVREVTALVQVQARRAAAGLAVEPTVLHMIFRGNPGTGKTTVARALGHIFREIGVLDSGHLVEAERADLVGEYIGHTAQKTRAKVREALGGILFIDEAYSLARGGEKDFGKEAIDGLVKAMEDHKEEFALILAGYPAEMDWFLRQNPGLRSRFPIHLDFPDFTAQQLLAIACSMLDERQYCFDGAARERFTALVSEWPAASRRSGNARGVRNLVERAIRSHALRLVAHPEAGRRELMTITAEDLMGELP